ncbi:mCG1037461, partial [Mus musculus]
ETVLANEIQVDMHTRTGATVAVLESRGRANLDLKLEGLLVDWNELFRCSGKTLAHLSNPQGSLSFLWVPGTGPHLANGQTQN